MEISIRRKLLLIAFIILSCNGFIGYAVYISNQKLHSSEHWVQHTEQVIYLSGNILALAKDVETASWGFVVTNDSTLLKPLWSAQNKTDVYIAQLKQLIKDNPAQQQRVDSLTIYLQKRLNYALQTAELRSKKGLAPAITFVSTGQGKNYTDHVQEITDAIQQEEATLLKQRNQTNERSIASFNWFSTVMFILMLVFTILLLIVIGNYLVQNKQKEKRAAELIIANKELVFQNEEKGKRAAELIIANKELVFQNEEKGKRAAELVIANKELVFQNEEKEKRAAELIIANKELVFQNEEKEKRASELIIANKELLAFTYISSHDLQEPLRKIQTFAGVILDEENNNLSDMGKYNFQRIQLAARRMQHLIKDLLAYSRINETERKFEKIDLNIIIAEVMAELKDAIQEKHATIEVTEVCPANIIPFQFRQLMINLVSNALKFSNPGIPPHIVISSKIVKGNKSDNENLSPEKSYCHIAVKDNGIGFDPEYRERIFGVFQRLHGKDEYDGTGIGLAIVKKIVENHNGIITATGILNIGATFDIYIPTN